MSLHSLKTNTRNGCDTWLDMLQHQLDVNLYEDNCQKLIYESSVEKYNIGKEVLRTLVTGDLVKILEEHIENVPQLQLHDIFSQLNSSSFGSGNIDIPKNLLLNLVDFACGGTRSPIIDPIEPSPTQSLDETLLQSLTSMQRRTNAVVNQSTPLDVIEAFVGLLQNSSSTKKGQLNDLNGETSRIGSTEGNNVNGFNNSSVIKKNSTSVSMAATVRCSKSSVTVKPYPESSPPGPQINTPPPPYSSYQPTVPPPMPTRPY